MARIKYAPENIGLDNPDVLSIYAQLLDVETFRGFGCRCPVCGELKYCTRITCQRAYCKQVWKLAKGLYRLAPKPEEEPVEKEAIHQEKLVSSVEDWIAKHDMIDCAQMRAKVSSAMCGKHWNCFEPSRCANVPDGTPRVPRNDLGAF